MGSEIKETHEDQEALRAEPTAPPRLSQTGLARIQGRREMAVPADAQAEQQRLCAAAQEAMEKGPVQDSYIHYRRYASEGAACAHVSGAVGLDAATEGFQGGNYPTYDLSTPTEVASVKTHWSADGQLNRAALNSYLRDFKKQSGWERPVGSLEQDGAAILQARDQGVPVPPELTNADESQAALYLRDHSRLRVPDDHVTPVRQELERRARQFPENYFLPPDFTEADITALKERVQGIGLTSTQLEAMVRRKMGTSS